MVRLTALSDDLDRTFLALAVGLVLAGLFGVFS